MANKKYGHDIFFVQDEEATGFSLKTETEIVDCSINFIEMAKDKTLLPFLDSAGIDMNEHQIGSDAEIDCTTPNQYVKFYNGKKYLVAYTDISVTVYIVLPKNKD